MWNHPIFNIITYHYSNSQKQWLFTIDAPPWVVHICGLSNISVQVVHTWYFHHKLVFDIPYSQKSNLKIAWPWCWHVWEWPPYTHLKNPTKWQPTLSLNWVRVTTTSNLDSCLLPWRANTNQHLIHKCPQWAHATLKKRL